MTHILAVAAACLISTGAFSATASTGPVATPKTSIDVVPLQSKIPAADPQRLAVMCLGNGEELSGASKICYDDCGGSTAAMTISVGSLCPLTIDN